MSRKGKIWTIAAMVGVGVVLAFNAKDIYRYIRIRSM